MLFGYIKRGVSCAKWVKFDVWIFSGAWNLELGAFLVFGAWDFSSFGAFTLLFPLLLPSTLH
jgi:hypothetical protein